MIKSEKPKPKFIHRNTRQDELKLEKVLKDFHKRVTTSAIREVKQAASFKFPFESEDIEETGAYLLSLRKQLVEAVKEGMIEQKDQEEKIALLAALVWFYRQGVEHRARILAEWG